MTDESLRNPEPIVVYATFASAEYDEGSLEIIDLDGEEFSADEWEGDIGSYVESFSAPEIAVKGLPAGLKYNANTGCVEGAATVPGVYTVTVTATNASVKMPTEDSAAEFTLVVPNLTAELIPVDGSYREMTPGVEYTIEIPEAEGCKVTGLHAGMKWTAKDIFPKDATLTYDDKEAEKPWSVTLKFKATGAVEVKGDFVAGKDAKEKDIVYKATGSATQIPMFEPTEETDAFTGMVFV